MATLKHLASKSADYGKVLEYLMFEHDQNGNPVRNKEGKMIMREQFILDGINCAPFSFDKDCERLNWKYHKNQKYSDIKSHHYIISFDPLDKAEGWLTPERAQELGMEFARRCFPGHQLIVCTHNDGSHKSGNIHVHIIMNSLRKLDVEKQPYMERDIDCRAGYKHHVTPEFLRFLQEEVMKMCEREGLHQVDLLAPAKTKITDREYRAQENGQKKLDEMNEQIRAAKMKPRNTVFQTQKQFLRDAITDAAAQAATVKDFQKILLDKYGVEMKDRRGRYSYLHPERKKYVTGRALGADFEKEYLEELIRRNAAAAEKDPAEKEGYPQAGKDFEDRQSSMSVDMETDAGDGSAPARGQADRTGRRTEDNGRADSGKNGEAMADLYCGGRTDLQTDYDPSYDYHADPVAILFVRTRLRLVVDLQTNIKAQMSEAYAQKVKISNLQEMARTVVFLQEQGIGSHKELLHMQNEASAKYAEIETAMQGLDGRIRKVNEQIHFAGQYYTTRSVHDSFMKSWNKGLFRSKHREELERYDEAVSFFRENRDGKIPQIKDLKAQREELFEKKARKKETLDRLRKSEKTWKTAAANVDAILGTERDTARDLQPVKRRKRGQETSL